MANTIPLVSFLVTVFNREEFLRETVDSILRSSFEDFEVVIVDDCSTDDSVSIAKAIAKRDDRISVHVNERNLGDYANRNRAASLARGKYLKYLDSDDLIYRHSLATMVEAMEQYPEAAVAMSNNIIDPMEPYPKFYESKKFFRKHFFGRSPIGVGPSAAIIRRDCFDKVGGFSGKQFVGDTELWLRLLERWPMVALPPALIWWRQHEGQQMQLEITKPEVLNTRFQLELETIESTEHLTDTEKSMARRNRKTNHARMLLSMAIRKRCVPTAWRLYRDAGLSVADLGRGLFGYV